MKSKNKSILFISDDEPQVSHYSKFFNSSQEKGKDLKEYYKLLEKKIDLYLGFLDMNDLYEYPYNFILENEQNFPENFLLDYFNIEKSLFELYREKRHEN